MRAFGVLRTVSLDYQFLLLTDKIADIRPQRLLIAKLEPTKTSVTQVSPEQLFL